MDKLIIRGGNPLYGEVDISGMKNSALPIIFGTIAANDVCTIGNVPDVSDISLALETLRSLGAKVRFVTADTVLIDTRSVVMKSPPLEFVCSKPVTSSPCQTWMLNGISSRAAMTFSVSMPLD